MFSLIEVLSKTKNSEFKDNAEVLNILLNQKKFYENLHNHNQSKFEFDAVEIS